MGNEGQKKRADDSGKERRREGILYTYMDCYRNYSARLYAHTHTHTYTLTHKYVQHTLSHTDT